MQQTLCMNEPFHTCMGLIKDATKPHQSIEFEKKLKWMIKNEAVQ